MNEDINAAELEQWINGMGTHELEEQLKGDTEMQELRADHQRLKAQINAVMDSHVEPPYPDFFNSRIARSIREQSIIEKKEQTKNGWMEALRSHSQWLWAPVTAMICFFLGMQTGGSPESSPLAHKSMNNPVNIYTPDRQVTARIEQGESTVIILDGLKAIPESVSFEELSADAFSKESFFAMRKQHIEQS